MLHNVFISHICYTPSSRTLSHHSLTFPRVQTVTGVKISIALTTSSSDFLCSLPSQSYLLGSNCEKREKRKNDIEVGGAPEMCDSGGFCPLPHTPPTTGISQCTHNHVFRQLTDATTSQTHLIFFNFGPQHLKRGENSSDPARSRVDIALYHQQHLPHTLSCRGRTINTWLSNSTVLQQRKTLR